MALCLKRAGFDGIVLKGSSKEPVYLAIIEGQAEIRDALHLWGKDTLETFKIIKEELNNERAKVVVIGPAGENLIRFAAAITDERRAAGRTGMGAVMGSKRLKAIVAYGSKRFRSMIRQR